MRWLRKGEFYVIYLYDDERKTFNVIGPAFEGDNIDERTGRLRDRGRRVHICVSQLQKNRLGFHLENYNHNGPDGYKYDPRMRW